MRAFTRLGFSLIALVAVIGCRKEEPKPEAEPAPEPPPAASEVTKAGAPEVPPAPPVPQGPAPLPAPEDVAAPPKDAVKSKTGLASKVLTPGKGKVHPGPNDQVRVGYAGWTKDGKMFDASPADKPISFGLGNVIAGWTEGLQLMVEGEKRRLWIPAKLAYGDPPKMPGAPAGDLVFDVELLEIVKAPEAPKDVAKPPADAKKTASGLAYKVLTKGKGKTHPSATSRVTVHYSGWTTDGKLFDSSVQRGQPSSFGLNGVIKGWTEGVQLMVEGEKTRFWIPGELAYGDKPARPGAPAGTLVFDIELLQIQGAP
jgi:FKBP-type peptidyl-prolyl cis-trans isomerase